MTTKKKVDVYQIITDAIIEKLKGGVIPWQKPFLGYRNGVSKKEYNGLNTLLLAGLPYKSINFYTFNQISKLGGNVRKGEKSHIVTFWKFFKYVKGAENATQSELDDMDGKVIPMIKYFRVFNYEQCENMPAEKEIKKEEFNPIAAAENIIVNYEDCPEIKHGGEAAFYRSSSDFVNMPQHGNFAEVEEYYSTLFHELIHSTGHKSRLDRASNINYKHYNDRSFEELIAEIGASFLCGITGIENKTIDNSAAYIASWLQVLNNDNKFIVRAASQAKKAAEYIQGIKYDNNGTDDDLKNTMAEVRTAKRFKNNVKKNTVKAKVKNEAFQDDLFAPITPTPTAEPTPEQEKIFKLKAKYLNKNIEIFNNNKITTAKIESFNNKEIILTIGNSSKMPIMNILKLEEFLKEHKPTPEVAAEPVKKEKSNRQLIKEVKEQGEDFEFYPTTPKLARVIFDHIEKDSSVLDIGAGNGNIFKLFDKFENEPQNIDQYERKKQRLSYYYAIEKSQILIKNMPANVSIVGTDFNNNTLIDKKVGCIFSNPPYSDCENWASRIITEANAKHVYIIMPVAKWDKSKLIKDALERRNAGSTKLFKYNYRDAKDRAARTDVAIYYINYQPTRTAKLKNGSSFSYQGNSIDPFDLWFDEHFATAESKANTTTTAKDYGEDKQDRIKNEIAKGRTLIDVLVDFYNRDLDRIIKLYKAIVEVDSSIFSELNIEKEAIKESLKMKIAGLKNSYWSELFNNLKVLTDKMTYKTRETMQQKLFSHANVDFTISNAYAVICWALKNANKYFDSQLVEVYQSMTATDNVTAYKSNKRFLNDGFRSLNNWEFKRKATQYTLDYRLILASGYNVGYVYFSGDSAISKCKFVQLQDIFIIAKNLGFNIETPLVWDGWRYGKKQEFYLKDGELFAEIKVYQNGNAHYKLNQKFMKKFNLEAGRLLGWLKDPQHAAKETGYSVKECKEMFNGNLQLTTSAIALLN